MHGSEGGASGNRTFLPLSNTFRILVVPGVSARSVVQETSNSLYEHPYETYFSEIPGVFSLQNLRPGTAIDSDHNSFAGTEAHH
jgi:hypothetical protein